MKILAAALVFALAAPGANGNNVKLVPVDAPKRPETFQQYLERSERFELFTGCSKVFFWHPALDKDVSKLGLTRTDIQRAIESRLRAARLYTDHTATIPTLSVFVTVVGAAFSIRLVFEKELYDQLSDTRLVAPSWQSRSVGTHGKDPTFVLSGISGLMDEFLTDYLRVNSEACDK